MRLTRYLRLSIIVRIDRGGGLVVSLTPNRDNQSTAASDIEGKQGADRQT